MRHELRPNAVNRLYILLLDALNGDKAHAGSTHGFTDRLGIVGVVLVALHIGFYELRVCVIQQYPQPLITLQATLEYGFFMAINTVQMEHVLCQIYSNTTKLHVAPSFR